MPAIKKLNLNPVAGMSGEHKLETGDIPQSPRARTDSVLETPRTAMGRKEAVTGQYGSVRAQAKRSSAQSAPRHARRLCNAPTLTRAFPRTQAAELHGEGPVAIASTGDLHASIGVNGKLAIWQAKNVKEGDELLPLCQVIHTSMHTPFPKGSVPLHASAHHGVRPALSSARSSCSCRPILRQRCVMIASDGLG